MYDTLIEKQVLYAGKKIRLEVHHYRDPNGVRFIREIIVHPGAVVILPMLDSETIVLIRNLRHTVGSYLLEVPAGTLEPGEPPIDCAGRELLEETGYLAGKLTAMASFYASPGIMTEKMYCFIASDLQLQKTKLDDGEKIELATMKLADAIDAIRTGEIVDSKTIAALLMYDRFYRK